MMCGNVVAVVVTYNSEASIRRLLASLLKQTYPLKQIVIVDNDSQDNTCQIIQKFNTTNIQLYQLNKNLGGAGGFAYGLEQAMRFSPDMVITFDDDAYPKDLVFIENMVKIKQQYRYDVVAPLVVDTNNHELTAYEYIIEKQRCKKVASIQKRTLFVADIKLFNGVLFDKKVIEQLKGPRPEFFIRGDEQEFKMRILQAGFHAITYTSCIVYHPTSVNEYYYIGNQRYHHLDSSFKLFYSTRNQYYILKLRKDLSLYKKSRIVYKSFWRYTWFYLIHRKGDIKNYVIWLKAFIYGLTGYMNNNVSKTT